MSSHLLSRVLTDFSSNLAVLWCVVFVGLLPYHSKLSDPSGSFFFFQILSEKMTMTLIRNRLALLVLGILVTFVLYLLLPAIQHEKFTASVDIPKPRAMEEEVKGTGAGNVTITTGTILHSSVFFREAVLVQKDVASSTER